VATVTTEYNEARRNAEVFDALDKKGMSSTMEVARARDRVRELAERRQLEQERLGLSRDALGRQLSLEEANVRRLRAVAQFMRDRVAAMRVTAGEPGVLQTMDLDFGQWVVPGQVLARVAQPGRLKALLRVPETQAKDVAVGQRVGHRHAHRHRRRLGRRRCGARLRHGRHHRRHPRARVPRRSVGAERHGGRGGGARRPLPPGARADLSVDGTVEIERLADVLSVGRPAYGQPESTIGLFRLSNDGTTAERVKVTLGRASVNAVEIVRGLNPATASSSPTCPSTTRRTGCASSDRPADRYVTVRPTRAHRPPHPVSR
jgi:multidrug efflux pump subunit AcrA (membrane-fusion protein)